MTNSASEDRTPLLITPEQGRKYDMGRMHSVFFADGDEAHGRYSISEWWIEPRTRGPGAHSHPEDHIFCVVSGTLSLFLDGERTDAPRGSYAVIPGGVSHDFENHGEERCGFICINLPAGFENMMPSLVEWFASKPLEEIAGD